MIHVKKKSILLSLFLVVLLLLFSDKKSLFAETVTPTPSSTPTTPTPTQGASSEQISNIQDEINKLESKVSELQSESKTLSSQIEVMDSQMKLTEYRINATKQEMEELNNDIESADNRISNLEGSLDSITKVMMNRIVATYQIGTIQPIQMLLASDNIMNFITRANYLRIAQAHDKKLIYNTVQARNDYENQKDIFEKKKQRVLSLQTELEEYTDQLDSQKAEKQKLLDETRGSESRYQQLLSQARAQLAAFSRFTIIQGGASLLGNQTSCDDWGCYYNQRDSQWGAIALNNTGYSLASDGCLVTSMAMVYTHYGYRNVTPLTINSNPNNFASYYPAYLNFGITAGGASSQRTGTNLDATLAAGDPVVVGISYDGGPQADHFVVFISGSNGSYQMNDPFTPNGKNISFRGRYPSARIVQVQKVVFN